MLSKCHDFAAEFIISDYIVEKVQMPRYLQVDSLGAFQLRGKQQEVEMYSACLSVNKEDMAKRRRRLFRRKAKQV